MAQDHRDLTDEEMDALDDYFFAHFARHDEDFAACERWIEDLSDEAIDRILIQQK